MKRLALLLSLLCSTAHAEPVDVALVLAIDVSGSVSTESWRLQRDGIADAIASPEFGQAVVSGQIGRVAVTVMQWGSMASTVLAWRTLQSPADAAALAHDLRAIERRESGSTCLGNAIAAAVSALSPWADHALRRVIDVSGDGASNCGADVGQARVAALNEGITINGLPIVTALEPTVDDWYAANVIGGPGAFLVVAEGYESFADAMRKKLTVEIAEAR